MKNAILVALIATLTFLIAGTLVNNRIEAKAAPSLSEGQFIFRYDTFGDEQLWTDVLQMQKAIRNVSPATALSVGLKVDSEALPAEIISAIQNGDADLDDPQLTIQLLKLNAVVGVIGKVVGPDDNLATIGITCALCHSMVDNSVEQGIGKRLDGWANTDLNVGQIVALSPALTVKEPFISWGPGKFDPRFQAFNGKKLIPLHSPSLPVVIPPIFGLAGVGFETFTADGPISYWNNYVGVTQMGGQGTFKDPRIGLKINQHPDLVTSKLPALLEYQLSLTTPPAPEGTFDEEAAQRGEEVFNEVAECASCHIPPTYTDVLAGPDPSEPLVHDPLDIGTEPVYASRSATGGYRTTPLRALWQHAPYFHDGSVTSLRAVVDTHFGQGLTEDQKNDLVEFLRSL